MRDGAGAPVGEVDPSAAWQYLEEGSNARLIDVRTRAEWAFVGVPDLGRLNSQPLFVEWAVYPDMSVNPRFAATVEEALGGTPEGALLFICRSGQRSLRAAMAVQDHFAAKGQEITCINVAEGFEGDLDAAGHRGDQNGWKARGLAWRQS